MAGTQSQRQSSATGVSEAASVTWQFWKAYAEKVGAYQAKVVLTAIYLLVVGPTWAIGRITRHHFLPAQPRSAATFWREARMGLDSAPESLKKQG
jgi:hypothetical protein